MNSDISSTYKPAEPTKQKPNQSNQLTSEAEIVGFSKKDQQIEMNLIIKRQIGCGKMNCCSQIFTHFFSESSELNYPLGNKELKLLESGELKAKQKIQISIPESQLILLVLMFYLGPLLAFLVTVMLVSAFTSSSILMFLAGVVSLAGCFYWLRQKENKNLIRLIQIQI